MGPRSRHGLAIALLLAVACGAGEVAAQAPVTDASEREPTSADIRVANDLYKTGLERVKEERWDAARDAFARAYELYPQPVILANLAGAEVRTGRIVAGVEHYRQVLKKPTGMSAKEVELVSRAMKAAEARLAHVHVVVADRTASDRVELDDSPLPPAALDIDYPVDPGKHVVVASRPGAETARVEVVLGEGETKRIRLAPRPRPRPSPMLVTPDVSKDRAEDRSIVSSPWFWAITGAVVAGAAVTLCVAAVCRSDEGYSGNLGRVTLP